MHNSESILDVMTLHSTGVSKRKISKDTNIPRSTVIRWIKLYKDDFKKMIPQIIKTHGKVKKKININIEHAEYIKKLYKDNPFHNRQFIKTALFDKFNVNYGLRKLHIIIKNMGYTYKKVKFQTIKNANYVDELSNQRRLFTDKIKKLDIDKIISIDESGFNTFYKKNMKGHAIKGQKLILPINEKNFKNQSLLNIYALRKCIYDNNLILKVYMHTIYYNIYYNIN